MSRLLPYLRVATILVVLVLAFVWQGYLHWNALRPVQVQATTGGSIMERVRSQTMPFGTIYIYACIDTRIGYVAVVNNQGVLYSWERMTNVMGEPQRFGSGGDVLPRLEREPWFTEGEIRGLLMPQPDGSLLLSPDPQDRPGWRLYEWEHESPNEYPSVFPVQ